MSLLSGWLGIKKGKLPEVTSETIEANKRARAARQEARNAAAKLERLEFYAKEGVDVTPFAYVPEEGAPTITGSAGGIPLLYTNVGVFIYEDGTPVGKRMTMEETKELRDNFKAFEVVKKFFALGFTIEWDGRFYSWTNPLTGGKEKATSPWGSSGMWADAREAAGIE